MWMQQYYPPMKNRITAQWPRVLLEPRKLTVWLEDGRSRSASIGPDAYNSWWYSLRDSSNGWISMDSPQRLDSVLDELVEWVKAGRTP